MMRGVIIVVAIVESSKINSPILWEISCQSVPKGNLRYAKEKWYFKYFGVDLEVATEELCNTPGCANFRYRDQSGRTFDYCSKYCRDNQPKEGEYTNHFNESTISIIDLLCEGNGILTICWHYAYKIQKIWLYQYVIIGGSSGAFQAHAPPPPPFLGG